MSDSFPFSTESSRSLFLKRVTVSGWVKSMTSRERAEPSDFFKAPREIKLLMCSATEAGEERPRPEQISR